MPLTPQSHHRIDRVYAGYLVAVNVFSLGLQGILTPLVPRLSFEFQLSLAQIGQVQTFFLIMYALFGPVWAYLTTRVRRRSLLMVMTIFWGACCLLAAVSNAPWQLALAYALAAIGNSAVIPLTHSMAMDLTPASERGYTFGWLGSAQTIGVGLAMVLGGSLVERMGWRAPVGCMAGLAAISVALLMVKRYEPMHGAMEEELQELFGSGREYTKSIARDGWQILWRPAANGWLLAANFFNMAVCGGVGFWLITMLERDHQLRTARATALVIGLYLSQVPASILVGWLSDRLQSRNPRGATIMLAGSQVVCAVGYGLGLLCHFTQSHLGLGFVGFIVGLVAGAAGASALPPLVSQAVCDVNRPEQRGLMYSLVNLTNLLGRALGVSIVSGLVAWQWSLSSGMAALNLLLVPALAMLVPVFFSAQRDRQAVLAHLRNYARQSLSRAA